MPRGFRLLWKGPEKVREFNKNDLKRLYKPASDSTGEDNGQVTIIGGSKLFHGAPILSLKVASRMVDMVFFASPESRRRRVFYFTHIITHQGVKCETKDCKRTVFSFYKCFTISPKGIR